MMMQALCRYYNALAAKGKAPLEGFADVKCAFAAELGEDGELLALVPLKTEDKRPFFLKDAPLTFVKAAGVKSNFLCDTSPYVFGIGELEKENRTQASHKAYHDMQHAVLDGCSGEAAQVMLRFVDRTPSEKEQAILEARREELLAGGNIAFSYHGQYIHEDAAVREAWLTYRAAQEPGKVMVCLVNGERLPVVKGHGKVRGVRNASTMGASLVAFNDYNAAESYGLESYENAPMSEKASFAFTTALNTLLADYSHQCYLGDATVVYWAEDGNESAQDFFAKLLQSSGDADEELHAAMEALRKCLRTKESGLENFSLDVPFYVLALSPNAGRVSVRFFLRDTLGGMACHLQEHYDRLQLVHRPEAPDYPKPWQLLSELANPNSKDKQVPPPLAGSFMRSILTGGFYPNELLGTVVMRIRAERNVSYAKAALIKAYLLKNIGHTEEEINVALNKDSDCKPYVLGRMFSLLEQIQTSASSTDIKATIKARYLASASATPGVVFPQLLRLQSAHMNKLGTGSQTYFGKLLGEVMNKLDVADDPFPAQLTLEQQGMFFLGYYQQDQARYEKKEGKENG